MIPPNQPTDSAVPIPTLLANLDSRDKVLREDAERALLAMGERVLPFLLASLEEETGRWRIRNRLARLIYKPVDLLLLALWLLLFLSVLGFLYQIELSFGQAWLGGWLLAALGKTCKQIYRNAGGISKGQQRRALLLTKMADGRVEMLGSLLEAMEYADRKTRATVEEVVTDLLWKVKFSDSARLGDKIRRLLVNQILAEARRQQISVHKKNPSDYLFALLQALSQIGDKSAAPIIQSLCQQARNPRLREAAEVCLLYLTETVERRRQQQTLLRPVETRARPDELLRPSTAIPETPPEQMLRASE